MSESAPYRSVMITMRDGLRVHARDYEGNPALTPVLCLPGLSRTARDFEALADHLAGHKHRPRRVVVLESRGRGQSEHDRNWENYSPLVEAQDALDTIVALSIDPAVIVGTSRGGILAMLMAAMRPGVFAGCVMNDIGPVIEMQGLARIKNHLSGDNRVRDWAQAVDAVRKSMAPQFPGFDAADWEKYARATYAETPDGPVRDFDPAIMKPMAGIDFREKMPPLWPQFAGLRHVPLMVIRGALSDILSAETVTQMGRLHPRLEAIEVAGQGHAPILDGAQLLARISGFVTGTDRAKAA
ncbi:MAG: alpha/beta fold hydrolase [Flavobacteriaceae bacterium]